MAIFAFLCMSALSSPQPDNDSLASTQAISYESCEQIYGKIADIDCFKKANRKCLIFRGSNTKGILDSYMKYNAKLCDDAKIDWSVTIEPAFGKMDAEQQVSDFCENIKDVTDDPSTIMIDIEPTAWGSDQRENVRYLEALTKAMKSMPDCFNKEEPYEIITSKKTWENAFGKDYQVFFIRPLAYIHIDGRPIMTDFVKFGGWTSPDGKKFAEDITLCSMTCDHFIFKKTSALFAHH